MKKKVTIIISVCIIVITVIILAKKPDNRVEFFYPNGALKEVSFVNNGELNGITTQYFENGNIKAEVMFAKGEQNGAAKFYYESGELKKITQFKNGIEFDSSLYYYKDGSILQRSYLIDGKEEGELIQYYQDGTIRKKGEKKNGLKIGSWSFYDSLGNQTRSIFYRSDTVQSIFENLEYRNLLAGFRVILPSNMQKLMEQRNTASYSAMVDDLGVVTVSMGSGSFTESSLLMQTNHEKKVAKESLVSYRIVQEKTLNENTIFVECIGKQNDDLKEVFNSKSLFAKNENNFIIVSTYTPLSDTKRYKEVQVVLNEVLKTFKLLPPEIIID